MKTPIESHSISGMKNKLILGAGYVQTEKLLPKGHNLLSDVKRGGYDKWSFHKRGCAQHKQGSRLH